MPSSFSTPVSLLERLRNPDDSEARERFALYCQKPVMIFARKLGVERDEIPDFVQDTFLLIFKSIPKFRYDPSRRFRGWLFTLMLNLKRQWHRKDSRRNEELVANPESLVDGEQASVDQAEFDHFVINQAFRLMKTDFEETTWQACYEVVCNEKSVDEVAKTFGMTKNAVYKARQNVLRRLREELSGILD